MEQQQATGDAPRSKNVQNEVIFTVIRKQA